MSQKWIVERQTPHTLNKRHVGKNDLMTVDVASSHRCIYRCQKAAISNLVVVVCLLVQQQGGQNNRNKNENVQNSMKREKTSPYNYKNRYQKNIK